MFYRLLADYYLWLLNTIFFINGKLFALSPLQPENLVYPTQLPRLLPAPSLSHRCDRSSSSADRLLSHSYHVIPFPVSHQEFRPLPLCHPSGRYKIDQLRLLLSSACFWLRRNRSFCALSSVRASISISCPRFRPRLGRNIASQGQGDTCQHKPILQTSLICGYQHWRCLTWLFNIRVRLFYYILASLWNMLTIQS